MAVIGRAEADAVVEALARIWVRGCESVLATRQERLTDAQWRGTRGRLRGEYEKERRHLTVTDECARGGRERTTWLHGKVQKSWSRVSMNAIGVPAAYGALTKYGALVNSGLFSGYPASTLWPLGIKKIPTTPRDF